MQNSNNFDVALAQVVERYGDRAADYLEGITIRREVTYDDYIQTDTLLSLQKTLTDLHDELTFQIYHQQTELWFRLTLHEMEAGIEALLQSPANIAKGLQAARRCNRILNFLTQSFDVLIDGLDTEEFLRFRQAFGSASGFQSAQFRAIEIVAGLERKAKGEDKTFYWERAARNLETGEPTLTLVTFKEKHLSWLNEMYEKREPYSFRMAFEHVVRASGNSDSLKGMYYALLTGELGEELKSLALELIKLDQSIIDWKKSHLRAAARHMVKVPRGTGDTNWAEYLMKSIQEEHYFPEIVTANQEMNEADAAQQEGSTYYHVRKNGTLKKMSRNQGVYATTVTADNGDSVGLRNDLNTIADKASGPGVAGFVAKHGSPEDINTVEAQTGTTLPVSAPMRDLANKQKQQVSPTQMPDSNLAPDDDRP